LKDVILSAKKYTNLRDKVVREFKRYALGFISINS
jgi:hypothetical protein